MLILSAETLEKISKEKKDENRKFSDLVKGVPSDRFDEVVKKWAGHFTSGIDCTLCANCCRTVHVGVTMEEIRSLASASGTDTNKFEKEEVDLDPDGTGGYLRTKPCKFLNGSMCSIYSHRPSSCRRYPGLDGSQLKYRMRRIMDEYSVCPIVYHTIEKVKKELDPDADMI
jgi:Fe-S-cluster containining protein